MIQQAFGLGLQEYLIYHYQQQLLCIREKIIERRLKENELFNEPLEKLRSREVTLLELIVQTEPLIKEMKLMQEIILRPSQVVKEYQESKLRKE